MYNAETGDWRQRHNREIREQTGQQMQHNVADGRRVRWASHCDRMEPTRWPKMVMEGVEAPWEDLGWSGPHQP